MTHASLYFEGKILGKFVKPHGKEFQQTIQQLNRALKINITTKHRYMKWFRCDGKCREKELLLFGYVSRLCNKSFSDLALNESHQRSCGGTFREVEAPSEALLKVMTKRYKEVKKLKQKQQEVSKCHVSFKFHSGQKSIDYVTTDDEA